MRFSSVDFPQPDGPTIQTNSPFWTPRLIELKTSIWPSAFLPAKLIDKSQTLIIGRALPEISVAVVSPGLGETEPCQSLFVVVINPFENIPTELRRIVRVVEST